MSVNLLAGTANNTPWVLILVVAVIISLIIGAIAGAFVAYKVIPNSAKKQAENIIKEAEVKGNQIVKSAEIDGRSAAIELKVAAEKEAKERKDQVLELEKKIVAREQQMDVISRTFHEKI